MCDARAGEQDRAGRLEAPPSVGSKVSSISTPSVSCSSTRPGRKPTWPEPTAAAAAASVCATAFRTATGKRRPSSPACHARHDRAFCARRPDQPARLRKPMSSASLFPSAQRRRRHNGQSVQPQGAEVRERSKRQAPTFSTFHPIARTSIRLRTPSPSSKPCCAKPPSERSTVSGPPSAESSISSSQTNVETTSPPQVTMQRDRIALA